MPWAEDVSAEGTFAIAQAVKSVASANRKVYMEYDVEPSREITGGAWCANKCCCLHLCFYPIRLQTDRIGVAAPPNGTWVLHPQH